MEGAGNFSVASLIQGYIVGPVSRYFVRCAGTIWSPLIAKPCPQASKQTACKQTQLVLTGRTVKWAVTPVSCDKHMSTGSLIWTCDFEYLSHDNPLANRQDILHIWFFTFDYAVTSSKLLKFVVINRKENPHKQVKICSKLSRFRHYILPFSLELASDGLERKVAKKYNVFLGGMCVRNYVQEF